MHEGVGGVSRSRLDRQVHLALAQVDGTARSSDEGRWCAKYEGNVVLCGNKRDAMQELVRRHPEAVLSGPST